MARTQVVEVETNIKGGGVAKLGSRTLIVGRNRAGKSTLVNAVEAAGSGRVSDVAGRASLAKDADLSMLGSGPSIFARATLSDGQVSTWLLEKGHRAKRTGPEIAFPLREVREALLGEPDKARRWILQNGGGLDWADVEALVPGALLGKLRGVVWDATRNPETPERLAAAIDEAKRRVREANAKAKNRPAPPAGPPPTDGEIAAQEARVAAFANALAVASANARLVAVRNEVNRVTAWVKRSEQAEAEALRDLAAVPASAPLPEVVKAAFAVIEEMAARHATTCAICGCAPPAGTFEARAAAAAVRVGAAAKAEAMRAQLSEAAHEAHCGLTDAKPTLARLLEEEKRLVEATAGPAPEGDPDLARAALRGLMERRAAWGLVRAAETEALAAEQEALAWGQLVDALSTALGQLVERARVAFEAKAQAFLPPGWVFGVDLLDGDREVLRVGLREADALRAALSGAEWATVTAALALATAPEDGPVVIAPEERAFDPDTLAEVLDALGSTAGAAQVVLTSPVAPSRLPDGWTAVYVGVKLEGKAVTSPPFEVSTPAVVAAEAALQAPPAPVKRGRGRPRKNGAVVQTLDAVAANIAPAPEADPFDAFR